MFDTPRQLVLEHLGSRAVEYMLGLERSALSSQEARDALTLSAEQHVVFNSLVAIDTQIAAQSLPDEIALYPWKQFLAEVTEETNGSSRGNFFRVISGGAVAEVPHGLDDLQAQLARMTIDVYPALLLREADGPFGGMSTVPSLFRHEENKAFQDSIAGDAEWLPVFPEDNEATGRMGSVLRSTGQGGGIQLWSFADTLIASGWRLARALYENPTLEQVIQCVLDSFTTTRAALQGRAGTVPARAGLAGVLLPDSIQEIDFGWAKLRKADERDEHIVKSTSLEGQLTTTTASGDTVVINYSGDLVLEVEVPYLVQLRQLDISSGWPEELRKGFGTLEELVQNVRLGLLLACPDVKPIVVSTWQVMFDPLTQGTGAGWSDVKLTPGLTPVQLSEVQAQEWERWARLVGGKRIPTISVAIRRMLASIAERRSADDVLVDAVIVWENLFGAKMETTLRITSSLAWLLGTSAANRRTLQTKYKKIYSLRSDVVHGAATVRADHLQEYSRDAVQISIDALRAVFESRPELLDIKGSEERSIYVLHQGTEPAA